MSMAGGRPFPVLFVTAMIVAAGCGADPAADQAAIGSSPIGRAEVVIEADPAATTSTPAIDTGADAVHRPSIVAEATVDAITARSNPSADGSIVAELANPIASGAPLVFRVVDGGSLSGDWLEVQLPVEPNGTTGWIERDQVSLSENPYRIVVDRSTYELSVFRLGELELETVVAIGTGDTPTPVGQFYLTELLAPPDPTGPYGPFAFGLSGFSEVLDEFGGADEAIIGLHGTDDPASLGTDVSHGCIRLANEVIAELATFLPLGTPVVIV